MLGQGKRPGGAPCPVPPHEGRSTGGAVPGRAPALGEGCWRAAGQQGASVGQSKANSIVSPIKLRVELADEGGAQDPDRPSGWWDVQTVESQCAQVIITVGVLAGSTRVSPLPSM